MKNIILIGGGGHCKSVIEHDCLISRHCHISTNAEWMESHTVVKLTV